MLKKITIILVAGLVIASGLLCLSCDDGEDPAMAMLQQSQPSSTPPPAVTPDETPAEAAASPAETAEVPAEGETPAAADEAAEGEAPAGESEVAAEGAEGEEAQAGDDAGAAEDTPVEGEAVEGEETAEDAAAVEDGEDASAEGEEAAVEGETTEGEEAAPEEISPEEIAVGGPGQIQEGFIEDGQPVSEDPIENFKAMDPRDIIVKKYEDMEGRKTEPWNEEDPENFIPETGRPDPMTRVFDSVPSALKPPRAGETDQNDINDYLIANEATILVQQIASALRCDNVIQIGLDKYATFSVGGGRQFLLAEGDRTGQTVGSSTGIPIQLTIVVTSITSDEVTVAITAAGVGTTTSVSKNLVYIPANQF